MAPDASRFDVLLVEDDLDLSEVMASYLQRGGLDVRTAHSASSALHVLSKNIPRLAVLDFQLPDRNGAELAQLLRQEISNLPVIIMSGAIGSIERASLEASGAMVFVNKPVPLRALLRACISLLAKNA